MRVSKSETKKTIVTLTGINDVETVNDMMMLIDGAIIHAQMGMDPERVVKALKTGLEKLTGQ